MKEKFLLNCLIAITFLVTLLAGILVLFTEGGR